MNAPLVRTEDGAILGPDYRRMPGMSEHQVPGNIPAEFVMPGDTIVAQGSRIVVYKTATRDGNAVIYARSTRGAEFGIVRRIGDRVRVVDAGAFDPERTDLP